MTMTDKFLANNDAYAAAFTKGDLPMPPAAKRRGRGLHGRPTRPGPSSSASRRATPT